MEEQSIGHLLDIASILATDLRAISKRLSVLEQTVTANNLKEVVSDSFAGKEGQLCLSSPEE